MAVASTVVRSFMDIPAPKFIPFIGSSYNYILGKYDKERYHLVLNDLYEQYGPICKQRIGNREVVHVFHPEDIQLVYGQEGKFPHVYPLQISALTNEPEKKVSKGLGSRLGDDWWNLRKNGQPAFLKINMVNKHIVSVNNVAKDLAHKIGSHRNQHGELDNLNREIGLWYFENTMRIGCGREMNAFLEGSPGRELGGRLVDVNDEMFYESAMLKLSLPIYKHIRTPRIRALQKTELEFIRLAMSLVERALSDLNDKTQNKTLQDNEFLFLRYILGRSELSMDNIYTLLMSLLTDGLSTTVPTLLFNIYCLSKSPQSQDKLYQEIQDVIKDDPEITTEHLKQMHFLKAFIKETLRLFPSGTEVSRITDRDLILAGYEVPKGTQVDLNFGPMYKSEAFFDDAHLHKPERWLRQGDSSKIHPYQYLPFSHGTRMCIGRRLAEQDMNVVLITLLRNFKLNYPKGEDVGQIFQNLLFPDSIIRVQFTPRT
eukprot:TRINITY_DN397_c1_g2_i1.p1 TRINITY_DN397_c1_g2~~TRINITY_DN397_c1_g2_i1.p1  ORF type:complete len:485 (+),score=30.47 TRINITY_DN397_c1_g2_i1:186-1640(+)